MSDIKLFVLNGDVCRDATINDVTLQTLTLSEVQRIVLTEFPE